MPECTYKGEDCGSLTPLRRGMCQRHYTRWKVANPDHKSRFAHRGKDLSNVEVLELKGWASVTRDAPYAEGPCWEWAGSRLANNYGRVTYKGKTTKAHRLAYETWVGPIPEGNVVRHKCDNPPCINPDHLDAGTVADNISDKVARGRSGMSFRVSEENVIRLREEVVYGGRPIKEVALEVGYSYGTAVRVVNGTLRPNVGGPIRPKQQRHKPTLRKGWPDAT